MPNVLAFTRKSDGARIEGQALIAIDDDMCAVLGETPHPTRWLFGWMDAVGFSLALSNSYERARETWSDDPEMVRVLDYLETYYDLACYYSY